jgi:hypothetical protein
MKKLNVFYMENELPEETNLPSDIYDIIGKEAYDYYHRKKALNIRTNYSHAETDYFAGARAWAKWIVRYDELCERFKSQDQEMFSIQQQYQQLKDKYDNILATEDGHLSATENVWQSGYAAGHEAGRERGTNELVQENERLKRWKMEAAELLTKINSYAHKHLEIKLGECAVEFVINRAKERDELKERCDKTEAALKELVRLKDKKDKEGNFIGYPTLKQGAWEDARKIIKEGESNTPAPVQGEKEVGDDSK